MADDKFILIGLDDERAKDVADVISNKTCKKILDYLSDVKEASEQDIAKGLGIPINTAEYNLGKLVKSGLVDKAKNFFWSVKGKKIGMFKLAKKHIIISPKSKRVDMKALKTILPVILIAAILVLIAGVYLYPKEEVVVDQDKIKQFTSQEELTNFLKQNQELNEHLSYEGGFLDRIAGVLKAGTNVMTATSSPSAAMSESASGGTADDYSTTNIQVEGVDEADIVKNDGKYIYVASGNKVKIVDAYPAGDMNILSEINISGVGNIFIKDDKLIVFANSYNAVPYAESKIASECLGCGGYGGSLSLVYIYDITDKENPKLEDEISMEGNYVDSRMIDNYVYVISTKYVNTENPEPPIYIMNGVMEKVSAADVNYWPYPDTSYVFTSITAINVENGDVNDEVYLTGSTNTIYVSKDNIYLTYQKTFNYKEYAKQIAEEVYYPILSNEYDKKIKDVLDSDKTDWEKLNEMQKIVNEYSSSLLGDDFSEFSKELSDRLDDFEIKVQKEREKTIVHKINVDNGNINYKGVGEVPGRILNQFSMDEFDGYFRIATTTGQVSRSGGTSLNHLYVLDKDLKIVGSVEDLAPGESIHSARFLGNRAYIVTFKKIDPLFVIDVSNPEKPEVLGYLKITGYSDYLHIYDENHVIGLGKETAGGNEQFSWYQGIKVSLFDVTDVENPVEEAKIEIGDRGTDSSALYEHKAFLFDKEKNLLVIPISLAEIDESKYSGEVPDNAYGEQVWQGVYVLDISLDGISERGRITHLDNKSKYGPAKDEEIGAIREIYGQDYIKTAENSWETNNTYYYDYSNDVKTIYSDDYMDKQQGGIKDTSRIYDYNTQIQRSLYMDDVLYTISNAKIKANNLNNVNEIDSLDLGYEDNYYPYPIYETGAAV